MSLLVPKPNQRRQQILGQVMTLPSWERNLVHRYCTLNFAVILPTSATWLWYSRGEHEGLKLGAVSKVYTNGQGSRFLSIAFSFFSLTFQTKCIFIWSPSYYNQVFKENQFGEMLIFSQMKGPVCRIQGQNNHNDVLISVESRSN